MRAGADLLDRVFPETPEPVNERHWLVPSVGAPVEVILLHSPQFNDIAVVAGGQVVAHLAEDLRVEPRIEVPFQVAGRQCVATLELVKEIEGTLRVPLEGRFVYDLFVDERSLTDQRRLQSDRARADPPLSRGGKTLLLLLKMIPSAGAPGLILGLNRASGANVALILGAIVALATVATVSYAVAARLLRIRRWSGRARLIAASAAAALIWFVVLPVGIGLVMLSARQT